MNKEKVEQYIQENKEEALKRIGEILGRETSMESFNGIIGGKNQIYAINPLDYKNPETYIADWHKKQEELYNSEINVPYEKSSHRIYNLMQDEISRKFIDHYLARIYYNKHM